MKCVKTFAPVIDVIPLPRGRLVEKGERAVLREGRADEAGDGLLQGGVERGRDALVGAELLTVGQEGGLGVVQEALAEHGLVRGRAGHDVDGRRGGPLGPVFEEGLGEQVRGREGLGVDLGRAGVEAGPGRGLEPPRAEGDGERGLDEGGLGQAGGHEVRDEGVGLGRPGEGHEGQDVLGAGERAGVGVGEDAGEFRIGQGDLAQAGDDLVEPVGGGWEGDVLDVTEGPEGELGRDDPEARELRFFLEVEELELERGQAPVYLVVVSKT